MLVTLSSLLMSVALSQNTGVDQRPSSAIEEAAVRGKVEPSKLKSPTTEIVTTGCGQLRGLVEEGVDVFRGIPYAAPPMGERRWKAPEPPEPWQGVRDCYKFGPSCPQQYSPLMRLSPLSKIDSFSEDCLYLNIFRPTASKDRKLPVMVWIHGGAYTEGSASMGGYSGASLARQGAVVVTINYRLGPFGFLAHPSLSAESSEKVSGNYGLLDQIAALRWLKQNIAAFGGDPTNVTIFGESAGGGSVLCLMVAPQAKDLFHRAIAQSAPWMSFRKLRDKCFGRDSAETLGRNVVRQCGLSDDASSAKMRELSVDVLLKSSPTLQVAGQPVALSSLFLPVEPIVDGYVIPELPNEAFVKGSFHHVPLLLGNTRDEASAFLMSTKLPTSPDEYVNIMRREFQQSADRMLAIYPPTGDVKVIRQNIINLMTDLVYVAQCRRVAQETARLNIPTFHYVFAHETTTVMLPSIGAHHGCEIPYLFGIDHPLLNWDAKDHELSNRVQQYWINFAKTGDPSGAGLPKWPPYEQGSEKSLELDDEIRVLEKYRADAIREIDAFRRDSQER